MSDTYKDLNKIEGNQLIRFQIIHKQIYSNHKELNKQNAKLIAAHNTLVKFFSQIIKIYDFNQDIEFIVSAGNNLNAPNHYVFKAPVIVPVKNIASDMSKYLLCP